MNNSAIELLQALNAQLHQDHNHIPELRKSQLNQMGAIVHAAAQRLPQAFLEKRMTKLTLDRRCRGIFRNSGIETVGHLVQSLPDGGCCAIKGYVLAVIVCARLLNLVPDFPTHEFTEIELKMLEPRFWGWLKEKPLPAEVRKSAILMVTKSSSGLVSYVGFRQIDELTKVLAQRCNRGSSDRIECILDLIHCQKVEADVGVRIVT